MHWELDLTSRPNSKSVDFVENITEEDVLIRDIRSRMSTWSRMSYVSDIRLAKIFCGTKWAGKRMQRGQGRGVDNHWSEHVVHLCWKKKNFKRAPVVLYY